MKYFYILSLLSFSSDLRNGCLQRDARETKSRRREYRIYIPIHMCTNKQTSSRFILRSLLCSRCINKDQVKPVRELLFHCHPSLGWRENLAANTSFRSHVKGGTRYCHASHHLLLYHHYLTLPIAMSIMHSESFCMQNYSMIQING